MFSSSLVLADLDYIAPSQACIKPQLVQAGQAAATVYRHTDRDAPVLADTIKISLQDCLACSGCVTSAETMLVGSQSREELTTMLQRLSALAAPSDSSPSPSSCPSSLTVVAVTVSPQSISSIAAHLGMSYIDTSDAIARFARRVWSAAVVTDLAWAQAIACRLTAIEYADRVSRAPHCLPLIVSSCPGWVCYCEKQYPDLIGNLSSVMSPQGIAGSILKFHAWSSCGSAGGGCGGDEQLGEQPTPPAVYHISVQPCFDRKLEAARDERQEVTETLGASDSDEGVEKRRYTDCVLSTQELLEWMSELDPTFATWRFSTDVLGMDEVATAPFTSTATSSSGELSTEWAEMAGSGGYHRLVLEAVANAAAPLAERDSRQCLTFPCGEDETATATGSTSEGGCGSSGEGTVQDTRTFCFSRDAQYEVKRNSNHRVVRTNRDNTEAFVLPWARQHQTQNPQQHQPQWPQRHLFCVAYGFQHIQNLVRALRKRTASSSMLSASVPSYTFIELMACPSGCLNGGGQVRLAGGAGAHDEMLQRVRLAFASRFYSTPSAGSDSGAEHAGKAGAGAAHDDEAAEDRRSASPRPGAGQKLLDGLRNFVSRAWLTSFTAADENEARCLPAWGTTVFHDRKKDMEELLKANPLHSLKW